MNIIVKKLIAFNKSLKLRNIITTSPYIYGIPKFHKTPVTFRFITSGVNSYNRSAGIILKNLLNIVYNEIRKTNTWIIPDNKAVLEVINNNANFNSIATYDFINLFTSIPLNDLRDVLDSYFVKFSGLLGVDTEFWNTLLNFCIFNNFVFNGKDIFGKGIQW